jgi:hypothetical protein
MGNRAVIAFQDGSLEHVQLNAPGIYLHWNGGPESVTAFLDAAEKLGVRRESEYGAARLCQIIGNWFGGTLSIGVGTCRNMDTDNGDNGTYVVDLKNHGWKVVRSFHNDRRPGPSARQEEIYAEVLEVNRPIFQPEKVAS